MLISYILKSVMVLVQFQDNRIPIEDKTRHERPAKLKLTLEQGVRALLAEDQRFTVRINPSQWRII